MGVSVNFIPKKRGLVCNIIFPCGSRVRRVLSCGMEFQMKLPLYLPFFLKGWDGWIRLIE